MSSGEPPMHISYVSYKMFAKYCGRHWQKQGSNWLSQVQFLIPFYCHKCSSSFLSIVKSHPLKIPASVLEKVRAGSCLKLFLIDCNWPHEAGWTPFHTVLLEKFLGHSLESNPRSLGWQSDVLTTWFLHVKVLLRKCFMKDRSTVSKYYCSALWQQQK